MANFCVTLVFEILICESKLRFLTLRKPWTRLLKKKNYEKRATLFGTKIPPRYTANWGERSKPWNLFLKKKNYEKRQRSCVLHDIQQIENWKLKVVVCLRHEYKTATQGSTLIFHFPFSIVNLSKRYAVSPKSFWATFYKKSRRRKRNNK